MKFSKHNNPSKRRAGRRVYGPGYSDAYIAARKKELDALLAKAETEADKEKIIKAFDISINPYQRGPR